MCIPVLESHRCAGSGLRLPTPAGRGRRADLFVFLLIQLRADVATIAADAGSAAAAAATVLATGCCCAGSWYCAVSLLLATGWLLVPLVLLVLLVLATCGC